MSHESDVTAFRKAFKLPIHEKPTLLTYDDTMLHLNLIEEEYRELLNAWEDGNLTETFDALIDLQYVINGMGVHMGLPMEEGWAEVQRSNMSKLDENGEPIYREDGKVLKSDLYSPPNLQEIIDKKE